jgi:putative nucleotidyltransferase with HDIG domain
MLGLNTVKDLALSTAVLESVGGKDSFHALDMDNFWTHSIGVGVTAKSLAAVMGVPVRDREAYFVAGLLHDLGKIPLNNCFPEEYGDVLESATFKQVPLYKTEHKMLEIDHCLVGGMIAEKWRLSKAMGDSLCYHHNPEEAKEENRPLISVVALANNYTNVFEIGTSGDAFPNVPMTAHLLEQVGVSESTLSDLRESVLDAIEKAKIFLQVIEK